MTYPPRRSGHHELPKGIGKCIQRSAMTAVDTGKDDFPRCGLLKGVSSPFSVGNAARIPPCSPIFDLLVDAKCPAADDQTHEAESTCFDPLGGRPLQPRFHQSASGNEFRFLDEEGHLSVTTNRDWGATDRRGPSSRATDSLRPRSPFQNGTVTIGRQCFCKSAHRRPSTGPVARLLVSCNGRN